MASNEEIEMIKDFLNIHGYKSTAECFEKETNYLAIEKKTTKVSNINFLTKLLIL